MSGIMETMPSAIFTPLVYGNLTHIDELLDLSLMGLRFPFWSGSTTRFPIINGKMYRFPMITPSIERRTELRLDRFDLSTGLQDRDVLIHDFYPEMIFYYSFADRGMTVYTESAAYLFNHNFEQLRRTPWPEQIPKEALQDSWRFQWNAALNDDFTKLAFAGTINDMQGVYLFDLTADTPPSLIQERTPVVYTVNGEPVELVEPIFERPSPALFTSLEHLFVEVGIWTGTAFFRLIDLEGNILQAFPFGATGEYAGGHIFANTSMVIFDPQQYHEFHYFDFETSILSPADWWRFNKNETWSAFIPDPNNPRIWYVSSTLGGHGSHQVGFEERSYIRRLDFENKTMEPIISVTEIHVTLMSVGANGELVFAYSGQSGTGFAVFYRGAN